MSSKKSKSSAVRKEDTAQMKESEGDGIVQLVTPSTSASRRRRSNNEQAASVNQGNPGRVLFPTTSAGGVASLVTPQPVKRKQAPSPSDSKDDDIPPAKRRLIFGKMVDLIATDPKVEQVYKIIKKLTGSIGGNGHVGPIYGELTMGSMQKMVNLMIENCDLNSRSRFIDVGSGIGKPNFHVAQCPGVAFSCGVEVEHSRWLLGMTCLKAVLDIAVESQNDNSTDEESKVKGNTVFLHKDIMKATAFDPFTHVYMFSIGFPPPLWLKLSEMWNQSQASYLICYHAPKDIIHEYEFDVELIVQMPTSMHGSKEGHMGYIYKRKPALRRPDLDACDPVFAPSWKLVQSGLTELHDSVSTQVSDLMDTGRKTRSRK